MIIDIILGVTGFGAIVGIAIMVIIASIDDYKENKRG